MKFFHILLIVFLFSILSLLIAVFLYYSHFNAGVGLSKNPTDWGTFGDYLGGVLNPFFGLLTLIALLITMFFQKKELDSTKKEIKTTRADEEKRKSENNIFKMFNLLSEISDKVTYYTGGIYYNGKKALNEYYDTLRRISIPFFIRINEPYDQNLLDTLSSFWNYDGRNIIHYFQLIRQLLEKFDSDTLIDQALFINLLKSQLSNDELCLFAYYCIWKSDQELYALVNEWGFFIDVRPNSLIEESHQSKFNGAFACPF